MKISDLNNITAKKIPNEYTGGWTWAIVENHAYGYDVIESGFSTRKSALEWLERNKSY